MTSSQFRVRWDEVDPIGHLRHTGYSAFAAQARIELFESVGITTDFTIDRVAPILFREELTYRREIRLGDQLRIDSELTSLTPDAGRWTIHQEVRRLDGELAATVICDGAWIDLDSRKLATPSDQVAQQMHELQTAG